MTTESRTDPLSAVGGDGGETFEAVYAAAMKKAFDEHKRTEDRILAGTWSEAELSPAMQEYVNQRRDLYTPGWLNPNKLSVDNAEQGA